MIFPQQQNHLTHFSDRIPVIKQHMPVLLFKVDTSETYQIKDFIIATMQHSVCVTENNQLQS